MATMKQTVYHGTTEKAAQDIVKTQEIWDSEKNNEWLGKGAYFFPYFEHALYWIKRQELLPGCVVDAELEFAADSLLDLDDPAQMRQMNEELKEFYERTGQHISIHLPKEKKELWKIWCLGCNTYRKLHKEIGIISYTFPQKKYSLVSGYRGNERQICVSNHKLIKKLILHPIK